MLSTFGAEDWNRSRNKPEWHTHSMTLCQGQVLNTPGAGRSESKPGDHSIESVSTLP